jgi:hypothetical protein
MASVSASLSSPTSTADNGGIAKEEPVVPQQQDRAAVARNNYSAIEMIETKAYAESNEYLQIRLQVAQKDTEIVIWSERIKAALVTLPNSMARATEVDELMKLSREVEQMKQLKLWDFVLSYQAALVLKMMELARVIEVRARKD